MQSTHLNKWVINSFIVVSAILVSSGAQAQNRTQFNGYVTGKYFKMPNFNSWNIVKSMNGDCEVVDATKADGSGQFVNISICPKGRRDSALTVAQATPILRQQISAEAARLDVPGCKKNWVDAYEGALSQAKGFQMIQGCGQNPAPQTASTVGIFVLADLEIKLTRRFIFPAPKDGIAEGTELVYHFDLK